MQGVSVMPPIWLSWCLRACCYCVSFGFISFYYNMSHNITSHFIHPQYDCSPMCCAVFLLVCLLAWMLVCWCICDCLHRCWTVWITPWCLCVFGKQQVSTMPSICFRDVWRLAAIVFHCVSFGFISSYYNILHNISYHASLICPFAVVLWCYLACLLVRMLACMLFCWCICDCWHRCWTVWITPWCLCVFGMQVVSVMSPIWLSWCLRACCYCVSFHFTIIYYKTVHIMHPQYDRSPLCCDVFLLVCLLVCMLACFRGVFAIVDIAVGRFG
jgi:hypothetical protein